MLIRVIDKSNRCCVTEMCVSITITLVVTLNCAVTSAQSLLYDTTDHSRTRNVIWQGVESPGYWYEAQPFRIGGHDNIASVSILLGRTTNVRADATGTVRFSIWEDNGQGDPGKEVGELGVVDIESLPRFDLGQNISLPPVTFDSQIDDLVPGGTYYLFIDYRDIDGVQFGDVLMGLSNHSAGTNRAGSDLFPERNTAPPFDADDFYPASIDFGSHQFLQMAVTSSDAPYKAVVCPVGTVYEQAFNLASDGTTLMPRGWAFSPDSRSKDFDGRDLTDEERLMRTDTRIFDTSITEPFPAERSLGRGTPVFNAGTPGDADRALALGVTSTSEDAMLQLVAEVAGGDANSIQLSFDIEAWDAANSRNNPGEAAFNVALDLDSGEGFQPIIDLGKVTTGATLIPPTDDFVDGNADANRTSFDSGLLNLDLPEGSLLRVRWMADKDANTRGWVFGLDNVSLGMFANGGLRGDVDNDGVISAADVDALSRAIRAGSTVPSLDLNGDSFVNADDVSTWIHEASIGNTYYGDANLDGEFNSTDMVDVFAAGTYETGGEAGWAEGDWNGDGVFASGDLVTAFKDGGYEQGPRGATATAVPEPSSFVLLLCGALLIRMPAVRPKTRIGRFTSGS